MGGGRATSLWGLNSQGAGGGYINEDENFNNDIGVKKVHGVLEKMVKKETAEDEENKAQSTKSNALTRGAALWGPQTMQW